MTDPPGTEPHHCCRCSTQLLSLLCETQMQSLPHDTAACSDHCCERHRSRSYLHCSRHHHCRTEHSNSDFQLRGNSDWTNEFPKWQTIRRTTDYSDQFLNLELEENYLLLIYKYTKKKYVMTALNMAPWIAYVISKSYFVGHVNTTLSHRQGRAN